MLITDGENGSIGDSVDAERDATPKVIQESGDDSEDEPFCRICRSGEESGKLYCPCRCAGSIKWIHETCLHSWLKSQDRQPKCELCGYSFGFLPVYAQHAPQQLTVADWLGTFLTFSLATGIRLLRILYAVSLWCVILPLSTVAFVHFVFRGNFSLPENVFRHLLSFALNICLGEYLSLAGIGLVYLISVVRNVVATAAGPSSNTADQASASQSVPLLPSALPLGQIVNSFTPSPASIPQANLPASGFEQISPPVPDMMIEPAGELASEAAQTISPRPEHDLDEAASPVVPSGILPVAGPAVEPANADLVPAEEDPVDLEEDLWNILGMQGNPLRSIFCMSTFLCANAAGILIFIASPFYTGRSILSVVIPLFATSDAAAHLVSIAATNETSNSSNGAYNLAGIADATVYATWFLSAIRYQEFPLPGQMPILDFVALIVGYVVLIVLLLTLVPGLLLLAAAFGCSSRGSQIVQIGAQVFTTRVGMIGNQVWLKIQMFGVVLLQHVLVPCYIGHLVVCLLCGPVLHLPPHKRANLANANMALTLVMQLFIGYVHLWGVAFLEGCFADVLVPNLMRRISTNFYVGVMCSHRRLFGNSSPLDEPGHGVSGLDNMERDTFGNGPGGSESPLGHPLVVSHAAALKLSLVHVAIHTPLAFVFWYLPARFLDVVLGEALFPVHIVDRTIGHWGPSVAIGVGPSAATAQADLRRRSLFTNTGVSTTNSSAKDSAGTDGHPLFAIEMLQLYFLILQCLHVLATSPGLARLVASGIRLALKSLGLDEVLAVPLPRQPQASLPATSARTEAPAAPPARAIPETPLPATAPRTEALTAPAAPAVPDALPADGPRAQVPAAPSTPIFPEATNSANDSNPQEVHETPATEKDYSSDPTALTAGDSPVPSVQECSSANSTRAVDSISEVPLLGNSRPTTSPRETTVISAGTTFRQATRRSSRRRSLRRPSPSLWRLPLAVGFIALLAWASMFVVMALPLSVGRALVYYMLSTKAKRISDFLPLSIGVVVVSLGLLAVVKMSEALPVIATRAASLKHWRFMHIVACLASATAAAIVALAVIPLGMGTMMLCIVLPFRASSVYQSPIIFPLTDCWSLGLVLTKVIWRLIQTDVAFHSLHLEFVAISSQVNNSLINLFFDLGAHGRIWRSIVFPVFHELVVHLLFPKTLASTIVRFVLPGESELAPAALQMFCCHAVLMMRLCGVAVPFGITWLQDVRQRIFDSKYLVSKELQNYHL